MGTDSDPEPPRRTAESVDLLIRAYNAVSTGRALRDRTILNQSRLAITHGRCRAAIEETHEALVQSRRCRAEYGCRGRWEGERARRRDGTGSGTTGCRSGNQCSFHEAR
jgi:hypothetical protein